MHKVDLKDAYFSTLMHWNSQKKLCLYFGLSPALLVFTKLLKVPVAMLRKLKVRWIIYLDDILLAAASIEELKIDREILIFLLQYLGFLNNVEKSVFYPRTIIEFLKIIINSIKMELSLSEERVAIQCQKTLDQK